MSRRAINPPELAPPVGFAHGWVVEHADRGATLYLAGQCGYDREGRIAAPGDLAGQLDVALANIGLVLRDAGLEFADVVQLNFYVRSRDDYAATRAEIGRIWRKHCGKHYPAMAMFEVSALYDPQALIEVQGIAAR